MHLLPEEYSTLNNVRFLQVKADAMAKVRHEFAGLEQLYKAITHEGHIQLPAGISHAKISRGENYMGLPYLVLDYPAIFEKEDILAFRTMFWWGNFFSLTLHLQGAYKEQYSNAIANYLIKNKPKGLYLSCGETPWEYHYEPGNYKALTSLSAEEINSSIANANFIKLSAKLPLADYGNLQEFMKVTFTQLVTLLKT